MLVDLAAVVDVIVRDGVARGAQQQHPAFGTVEDVVSMDGVAAAAEQADGVLADVAKDALLDGAVHRVLSVDHPVVAHAVARAVVVRRVVGLLEDQAGEPDVSDRLAGLCVAEELHEAAQAGSDHLGLLGQLGFGPVEELPGLAVQVPLAGRVQLLQDVLDEVAVAGAKRGNALRAAHRDGAALLVHAGDGDDLHECAAGA